MEIDRNGVGQGGRTETERDSGPIFSLKGIYKLEQVRKSSTDFEKAPDVGLTDNNLFSNSSRDASVDLVLCIHQRVM